MRDFLPEDVRKREYVIGVIKEVYERYGFEPLETPAVENIETLMGKYGEEGNQLIFKILKRGLPEGVEGSDSPNLNDLALRYDLTVPLARVVAAYRDSKLPRFFKRYQIQPVWRADRPARGRFREFYQCDVDVLDSSSMVVETEICSAAADVLLQLRFDDFTIRLNHRRLLTALLNSVGIPDAKHSEALVAIDKLDKLGEEGVKLELQGRGIATEALLEWLGVVYRAKSSAARSGDDEHGYDLIKYNSVVLKSLGERIGVDDEEGMSGLHDLQSILELTTETAAGSRIMIDPSLARGLSYYTGAIFEIQAEGVRGSLGGGGRYDNLVGMFLGPDKQIPACGFSLGLERIIGLMSERSMFPPSLISAPADVMVGIWYHKDSGEKMEAAKDSLTLARQLRAAGLRVYLYPLRNVVKPKQKVYALKRKFPFVAFVGEDERERGEVEVTDMRSAEPREPRRVKRELVAADLRRALEEHR